MTVAEGSVSVLGKGGSKKQRLKTHFLFPPQLEEGVHLYPTSPHLHPQPLVSDRRR